MAELAFMIYGTDVLWFSNGYNSFIGATLHLSQEENVCQPVFFILQLKWTCKRPIIHDRKTNHNLSTITMPIRCSLNPHTPGCD